VKLLSLYISGATPENSDPTTTTPADRFRIVRMKSKSGKRIVAEIKVNFIGKVSQEETLVPTTSEDLTGGWVKITPTTALQPGEYAVVELLGSNGVNTFVWDFGINPSAPANPGAVAPQPAAAASDKP